MVNLYHIEIIIKQAISHNLNNTISADLSFDYHLFEKTLPSGHIIRYIIGLTGSRLTAYGDCGIIDVNEVLDYCRSINTRYLLIPFI